MDPEVLEKYKRTFFDAAVPMLKELYDIEFVCKLGSGTYGDVIKVRSTGSKIEKAAKLIAPKLIIRGELEVWPNIRHERLLPVEEICHLPNGAIAVVMPLMYSDLGGVLRQVQFREHPCGFSMVVRWLKNILEALSYLHQNHLCHLDVKGNNVLVNVDGSAVVCDFTFTKSDTNDIEVKDVGLPAMYRPPECFKASKKISGQAVDLWGFGMTACEIFSGQYVRKNANKWTRWRVDIQPLIRQALTAAKMGSALRSIYPGQEFSDDDVYKASQFIHLFLHVMPSERISAADALMQPFLNRAADGTIRLEDVLTGSGTDTAKGLRDQSASDKTSALEKDRGLRELPAGENCEISPGKKKYDSEETPRKTVDPVSVYKLVQFEMPTASCNRSPITAKGTVKRFRRKRKVAVHWRHSFGRKFNKKLFLKQSVQIRKRRHLKQILRNIPPARLFPFSLAPDVIFGFHYARYRQPRLPLPRPISFQSYQNAEKLESHDRIISKNVCSTPCFEAAEDEFMSFGKYRIFSWPVLEKEPRKSSTGSLHEPGLRNMWSHCEREEKEYVKAHKLLTSSFLTVKLRQQDQTDLVEPSNILFNKKNELRVETADDESKKVADAATEASCKTPSPPKSLFSNGTFGDNSEKRAFPSEVGVNDSGNSSQEGRQHMKSEYQTGSYDFIFRSHPMVLSLGSDSRVLCLNVDDKVSAISFVNADLHPESLSSRNSGTSSRNPFGKNSPDNQQETSNVGVTSGTARISCEEKRPEDSICSVESPQYEDVRDQSALPRNCETTRTDEGASLPHSHAQQKNNPFDKLGKRLRRWIRKKCHCFLKLLCCCCCSPGHER